MSNDGAPSTTHAEYGAGRPRLIVTTGERRAEHPLGETTTIGSGEGCELILVGLDPVHATVQHDDTDEYVVTLAGEGELTANPETAETGATGRSQVLRHGARFTAGPYAFVFQRDEFADHGRPAGGRQGGEYAEQPAQPERPRYDQGERPGDTNGVEVEEPRADNVG